MAAADGSMRESSAKSFEKGEEKASPRSEKKEKKTGGNLSGRNPSLCRSTIRILLQWDYDLFETSLTAEAGLVKDRRFENFRNKIANCKGLLKRKVRRVQWETMVCDFDNRT